jgi:hypothetical protein
MKNHFKIFIAFFIIAIMLSIHTVSVAQPPPPPPGGGHGLGGNQGAGPSPGAPIGGGMEILMILGALYAGKKAYALREEEEKSE